MGCWLVLLKSLLANRTDYSYFNFQLIEAWKKVSNWAFMVK